jgi:glycosyltransferase involved in cell wall biosynthesis
VSQERDAPPIGTPLVGTPLVSTPLVSIVVPTYDRAGFLAEALASVVAQTVADWECVVVDDGSPEPVALPEPADPRIRVVRRARNGGPAAARNTGLLEARGAFVTFLDDDDLYTVDRLALGLQGVARASVAVCWVRFVDEADTKGGRRLDGDVSDTILDGLTPSLGAVTLARELALAFDERLDNLEDVDWWLRTAKAHRFTTVPRVGYLFRRHPGVRHRTDAASRVADNIRFIEREADYFRHHPRAAALRWKRVGLLAETAGDRHQARRAFARSLRLRPGPATVKHLLRVWRPSRFAGASARPG